MAATLPRATETKLSLRQRQILELIRRGKSNNEIAFELGIGLGTVKQHVVALFRKLKVTSRTMAISRRGAEVSFASHSPPVDPADVILERRPCIVLSLTIAGDDTKILRKMKTTLAMYAQKTDDIFLSWRGPGCDLILGIDQARETDALQALQGAWKTAEALVDVVPGDRLRGAVAAGLAVASMFRHGGWSGEAIASSAIVLARKLTQNARPGKIFLDDSILDLLRLCGAFVDDQLEAQLPLNTPEALRWHSQKRESFFLGRKTELADLESLFNNNKAHPRTTVHYLSGPPGSGKSRLCEHFSRLFTKNERMVGLYRCLPTQAPLPYFDARSGRLLDRDMLDIKLHSATGNEISIIDDTHWLTEEYSRALVAQALHYPGQILFVRRNRSKTDAVALTPLKKKDVEALAMEMIAPSFTNGGIRGKAAKAVARLAGGNPLFAVEMARHAPTLASLSQTGTLSKQYLPLQIIVPVTASLDRMHLDRRMLRMVASGRGDIESQDLAHALGEDTASVQDAVAQAVRSGVLKKTGKNRIGFAHPMFHNVIQYLGMES